MTCQITSVISWLELVTDSSNESLTNKIKWWKSLFSTRHIKRTDETEPSLQTEVFHKVNKQCKLKLLQGQSDH